jgi:Tfp pilus assembly protein PilN
MNRRVFNVAMPAAVAVMVVLLSALFFTGANTADAATARKKTAVAAQTTAVEHTESRIKLLEDALQLTDSQNELWKNVTTVMRENAKGMDALRKERSDVNATMNAVDRLKFHSQISEVQLEQLKKLIPPFEALYVSMSPEQKTKTDAIMQTGKHRKNEAK